VHYSRGDITKQEAPYQKPEAAPSGRWPQHGGMLWQNVNMSYRPTLPTVLKDLNIEVKGGEKIGIVGRTGAGKTSLVTALFRMSELSSGKILIDGVDIATLGLQDLRSKLSIIPQEPLLFSGTIRSNLDPFMKYDDARLYDALRRACLVEENKESDGRAIPRFSLDTEIESEGLNLSVGERSLLSLARAVVKDNQIVILDEATASVDLETDAKIQNTIQTEFNGRTLLCIAHRLRTILSYDRILVMHEGRIAEFDTPLNLYDNEGIFRGMCERSNIGRADIEKSRLALL